VLWDVDYTLVRATGLGNRLYQAVFRDMFGRDLAAIAPKAGRTDRAILLAQRVSALDGSVQSEVRALPGASAAIAALAAADCRQSVLTGNIRPLAALKLAAAGLSEHLDLDVGAYGDGHEVRSELVPVARQAARAAYGVDFSGLSTVLVGDTPLDVAAALATGARAVGVATGSFAAADLVTAGAHAVLPDLSDVPLLLAAVIGQP